jgi:hypothetical protein
MIKNESILGQRRAQKMDGKPNEPEVTIYSGNK